MKKIISALKYIFTITFSLLFISSCNEPTTPILNLNGFLPSISHDYEYAAFDDFIIKVDNAMVMTLIESKESFVLYYGNAFCGSCYDFEPVLIEYISKQKTLVYYYDSYTYRYSYPALITAYPDFFKENAVTPSLYFFKNGSLATRQIGNSQMMAYQTFLPMMESYARLSNNKTIHNLSGFNQYINTAQGLVFIYDRTNEPLVTFYRDTLIPFLKENNQSLTIIEKSLDNHLHGELLNLDSPFNLDHSFILFSHGQIITYETYLNNNDQQIINWLTDYL